MSERQLEAFLTPALASSKDAHIDYSTFLSLARPRAAIPSELPTYVRKADFSANGVLTALPVTAKVCLATTPARGVSNEAQRLFVM